MESELKMIAAEDLEMGQDLTPPLSPLAISLYDSHLLSHCSSCLSPLSPQSRFPPSLPNSSYLRSPFYCSSDCSLFDSPLHHASAEHHLLCLPLQFPLADSTDLRLALRLLHRLSTQNLHRVYGLSTNYHKLMADSICKEEDDTIRRRIRDGAKLMGLARRIREGEGFRGEARDVKVEEAMLCLVITNAVEVRVGQGKAAGIAVYGSEFSWLNHDCSPNACFLFLPCDLEETGSWSGKSRLRILPGYSDGRNGQCDISIEMTVRGNTGSSMKGPRIVVRTIGTIKEGEEVTIAYIDLLQPKSMRQSELWSKYRFNCCCKRCNRLPPTFSDHALQEVFVSNLDGTNLWSEKPSFKIQALEEISEYIDDAVSEYLSVSDPDSCLEKLENLLTRGFSHESKMILRLHPMHHLSLKAYTTLCSVYKIRSLHFLESEENFKAFEMARISAAYGLLLAGASHRLFLSERSLITSAAIFWTNAGESLLNLARSSGWDVFGRLRSCNCRLLNKLPSDDFSKKAVFEEISMEFLVCVRDTTSRIWSFLRRGCDYLEIIKDPISFNWVNKSNFPALPRNANANSYRGPELEREIFQLSVHCLVYGELLSHICYGPRYSEAGHSGSSIYVEGKL